MRKTLLIVLALAAGSVRAEKVNFGVVKDLNSIRDVDLSGKFVYAVDVGGPGRKVAGVVFGADRDTNLAANNDHPGKQVSSTIPGYYPNMNGLRHNANGPNLGDHGLTELMRYLRNDSAKRTVVMNVVKGAEYKLQVLAVDENGGDTDRRFNISIEGRLAVESLIEQSPSIYSVEFRAGDDKLQVTFDTGKEGQDHNPSISGITLEQLEKGGRARPLVSECLAGRSRSNRPPRPRRPSRKPARPRPKPVVRETKKQQFTPAAVAKRLKNLLGAVSGYQYGSEPKEIAEIKAVMDSVYGNKALERAAESQYVRFLAGGPSFHGRQFVCRELRIIGTRASVGVLSKMLADPKLSSMARYALEPNTAREAAAALIGALGETKGKDKAGIVNSLAVRRCIAATAQIEKLMYDREAVIAEAAIAAMGKISTAKSAAALTKARKGLPAGLQKQVMAALIKCAGRMAADRNTSGAMKVYEALCGSGVPWPTRTAALHGIATLGLTGKLLAKFTRTVVWLLTGKDQRERRIGVALIRSLPRGTEITSTLCQALPDCQPYVQEQVIYALADRGDKTALGAITKFLTKGTEAKDEYVRVAALRAISKLGDSSHLPLLLERAAGAKGEEQTAAIESLVDMKGADLDRKIVEMIPKADPESRQVLIRVGGERFTKGMAAALAEAVQTGDKKVRTEAIRSLTKISDAKDLPAMVGLFVKLRDEALLAKAETMLAAAARREADPAKRAAPIMRVLPGVKDEKTRLALIRVLARTGDPAATEFARDKIRKGNHSEKQAAAEGFAKGGITEAIPDILWLVKNERDPKTHVLAVRNCLALVKHSEERPRDDKVSDLSALLSDANRFEERKMVLAALRDYPCDYALVLARAYASYRELAAEAKDTAARIAESMNLKLARHPFYGEYRGKFRGSDAKAMVSAEKHKGKRFSYRIRVVGKGIDAGFYGRADRDKVVIHSTGWRGWIRDGRLEATRGQDKIAMVYHERRSPTEGMKPPAGAIVLLGFKPDTKPSIGEWSNASWRALADGSMEVGAGVNTTKRKFGSCVLHVEFATPFMPHEFGQGRGNSGVYLMGRYEVQVLDSFLDNAGTGNCGGIYNNAKPRVEHVPLPPLQWQTYDITFHAPKLDAGGKVVRSARFEKVVHNGVLIHENVEVSKPTAAAIANDQVPLAPLALQDHSNPVRYRNVWLLTR